MAYLVERQRALYLPEVVAIVSVRQRKIRSRVIMKDNSLYHTLTRPRTLSRHSQSSLSLGLRPKR